MKKLFILFLIFLCVGCEKLPVNDNYNNPEYTFDTFWSELDRNFSFFSYLNISWDSVYSAYRPSVTSYTTDSELFHVFNNMLYLLNDPHTVVFAPMGIAGITNYFEQYPINQIDFNAQYFNYYQANDRIFEYGLLLEKNIGYIKIKTFNGDKANFEKFDSIINSFSFTDGLIIDVRSNRGGLISNTKTIIKSIADTVRLVCKYRTRNGPSHNDFSPWADYYIDNSTTTVHYNKPIAVLTNRQSFSAAEWFVMSVRILPNVTVIGDTTGGGSAMPIIRELPNGWQLRISNTQTLLPSGRDFQFTGLYPDIPIWISKDDASKNIDTILEKAIAVLP